MVYVLGVLFTISLLYGIYKSLHLQLIIEVNTLSSPYYYIGVSFHSEEDETDSTILIEKLIVGLFFINFIIVFYKKDI